MRLSHADRRDTVGSQGRGKGFRRIAAVGLGAALTAQLLLGFSTVAVAQLVPTYAVPSSGADAPPLDVPPLRVLTKGDGLSVGDWMLYPSIGIFSSYTDNLFQNSVSPISTWVFGIDPSLRAEWTNGIHTTDIYGSAEGRRYPTEEELDAFDDRVGLLQKYSPLPDLTFSVQGDYSHNTLGTQLINAIPTAITAPGANPASNPSNPNPPNPNPTPIGPNTTPTLTVANATTVINPNDVFTGLASVEKILNGGIIGLGGQISRTEYQNTSLNPDYTVKSLFGRGAFWLGPMFYLYANGSLAAYQYANDSLAADQASTSFTARGGIGTRQIGLFSASAYFGQQGTETESGSAGGDIYGGRLYYYATPDWTLSAAFDETINISSITGTSNLALNLPTQSVLVVGIGESTQIAAYSLQTAYTISDQWSLFGNFGYSRLDYIGSSNFENSWLADGVLRYAMTRELTLEWEYQYSSVVSNVPLMSSKRNFALMRATHKF